MQGRSGFICLDGKEAEYKESTGCRSPVRVALETVAVYYELHSLSVLSVFLFISYLSFFVSSVVDILSFSLSLQSCFFFSITSFSLVRPFRFRTVFSPLSVGGSGVCIWLQACRVTSQQQLEVCKRAFVQTTFFSYCLGATCLFLQCRSFLDSSNLEDLHILLLKLFA